MILISPGSHDAGAPTDRIAACSHDTAAPDAAGTPPPAPASAPITDAGSCTVAENALKAPCRALVAPAICLADGKRPTKSPTVPDAYPATRRAWALDRTASPPLKGAS